MRTSLDAAGPDRPRAPLLPFAGLALGVLAASTSAIFARLAAEAPPLVISAFRCSVAALVLALLDPAGLRRELARWDRRTVALALLAGAFMAVHFGTWLTALVHSSVASAVFLVNTTPLWAALLGPLVTSDRPGRGTYVGLALALAGSAAITFQHDVGGRDSPLGAGLALLGALAMAGYMLVGRRVGSSVGLRSYLVVCYGSAALLLWGAMAAVGQGFGGYRPDTWTWLLALALVPQLVGHSACNWALRWLPTVYVALAYLGEPLLASGLAWGLLDELPPRATLWGGPLVLLGIVVAGRREARDVRAEAQARGA
ncbi:MAG: DMT family transporter [Planctomycetes bacterium]|nr:DMT family transporter [Planctomycetota bacterium]